ncbi:hypothetical protein J5X84_30200 [Streptosporangiaceae bacterium NEAU-GS5]|nr:hypothetical protein [Streptosporangiaceae bacterium NEAU-GS5]
MITQTQAEASALPDPEEEARRAQTARLLAYRDDGPLARWVAPRLGRGLPEVPATLVALAIVAALAVTGAIDDVDKGASLLVPPLVLILLIGATAGRDHLGRFDWLTPPLIRAAEFVTIILYAQIADAPKWLTYALLYVIGYHTYDTVYRTRQAIWPPEWLFRAGLGWELRLLVIGVGAALGQLTPVMAVLTAYLFVLFTVESVVSWVRLDKAAAQSKAEADQDLEQAPEDEAAGDRG